MEFSDEQGRGYAVAPCSRADLLVLHYVPEAARSSNGSGVALQLAWAVPGAPTGRPFPRSF